MKFAWSYSRYSSFQQCPAQFRYRFILKLPEEKSIALERGGTIHELMAKVMRGEEKVEALSDKIKGFRELAPEIKEYVQLYKELGGGIEQPLAADRDWKKTEWFAKNTWVRGIIDFWIRDYLGKGHALLVDWKTGKFSNYNLDNYEEQLELFCTILFANDKSIKAISPMLMFLDAGISWPFDLKTITRKDVEGKIKISWYERAMYIENEIDYNPRPGPLCKWCSFSKTKQGPCREA